MNKQSLLLLAVLFTVGSLLNSCGGNGSSEASSTEEPTAPPQSMVPDKQEPIEVSEDGSTVIVRLTGDDQMKYNLNRIEVKEGQTIKLTLTHIGEMSKEVMGHNFVLLQPETDIMAFATEANKSKDNDYIPQSEAESIIVHTEMIGGGESTSIEFEAPPRGTYKFICSFPAHYASMQGDLVVN